MPDNLTERGPRDAKRISLDERWEREYWSKTLGVSEQELERVVREVGPMADDVRRRLGK
jgi:hypothetical protein